MFNTIFLFQTTKNPANSYDFSRADSPAFSRVDSPNSLENESISDLESIFDTPRKTFLKSKLQSVKMDKQRLQKERKNLKRKYTRLSEKCKRFKDIVMKVKKVIHADKDQFLELCIKANVTDLLSKIMKRKKINSPPPSPS